VKTWTQRSVAARTLVIVSIVALVAGVVLIVIAITSGGDGGTSITDMPTEIQGEGSFIDWSNPPNGVLTDSVEAATSACA
jgi:hypothetical protein